MRIPVDGRSTRRMSRVQIPSAPPLNTAYPDRILACFRPLSWINNAFFLRVDLVSGVDSILTIGM